MFASGKIVRRRLGIAALLLLGAVGPALAQGGGEKVAAVAPGPSAPGALELAARLRPHVVTHDDFARSVFYTWTSAEQIAALRSTKTLLVARAATNVRNSPFLRGLTERVQRHQAGEKVAALLLQHPALDRRRYAWTSPFATVLGLGERSYGSALIKVGLRPEAVIVRFDPESSAPFVFVDLHGQAVPESAVLAAPERLGAIYHVRTRGPSDFVPFREYILCNEGMILSFAVATADIRARLAAESELLRSLRPAFAQLRPAESAKSAVPAWVKLPAEATLLATWRAALAFDNRKYRPQPAHVDKILAALAAYDGSGVPLEHIVAAPTAPTAPH